MTSTRSSDAAFQVGTSAGLSMGHWTASHGCGRRAEEAPTVWDPSARDVHPGRSVVGVQTVYALSGQ
jgi:hypothetical protein